MAGVVAAGWETLTAPPLSRPKPPLLRPSGGRSAVEHSPTERVWLPVAVFSAVATPSNRRTIRPRRRAKLLVAALAAVVAGVAATLVLVVPGGAVSAPAHAPGPAPETPVAGPVVAPAAPASLTPVFERWAREYHVPVDLLEALAWHESRWQPGARSTAGAVGIGQLMPSTAAAVARSIGEPLDPWRATDNIRLTARLLGDLLVWAQGDARTALAAYAQGAPSLAGQGPTPATQQAVDEILELRTRF